LPLLPKSPNFTDGYKKIAKAVRVSPSNAPFKTILYLRSSAEKARRVFQAQRFDYSMPACEGCGNSAVCEALLARIQRAFCATIKQVSRQPKKRTPQAMAELEQRILKLVEARPGITQAELTRKLPLVSSQVSFLLRRLERKGKLTRQLVRLRPTNTQSYRILMPWHSLASVAGVPCFVCADIDRCQRGGQPSPVSCQKLTDWVLSQAKGLPLTLPTK